MQINKLPLIIFCFGCSQALFVPEQLTTLLSFIYTNIPPIRKGTDSRVGLGFRLGPNADFQVTFELGPQENTQALGPQINSKRETLPDNEDQLPEWELKHEGLEPGKPLYLDQDVINHLRQLYKPQGKTI